MIAFKCHGCGTAFSISDDKAGKRAKCPKCGAAIVVPTPMPPQAGQLRASRELRSASPPDPGGKAGPEEPVGTAPGATALPAKSRLPRLLWVGGGVAAAAAVAVVLVLIWGATHSGQSHRHRGEPKLDPDEGSGAAWQRDWREFGKLLGSLTQTEPSVEKAIEKMNALLADKDVVWSGIVEKVVPPGGAEKSTLLIGMEKLSVSVAGQPEAVTERLNLTPTGREWKAWASVAAGSKVAFRTRLVKADTFGHNGVVLFIKFSGQMVSGPEAGKPIDAVWVIVNTSGAELIDCEKSAGSTASAQTISKGQAIQHVTVSSVLAVTNEGLSQSERERATLVARRFGVNIGEAKVDITFTDSSTATGTSTPIGGSAGAEPIIPRQ